HAVHGRVRRRDLAARHRARGRPGGRARRRHRPAPAEEAMSRARLAALSLMAILLLSGCAGSKLFTPQSEQVGRFAGHLTWPDPVAYNGTGAARPIPAALSGDAFPRMVEQMLHKAGGEPNIGVTSKGTLFVNTNDDTQRSTDQGRTWTTAYSFKTPG